MTSAGTTENEPDDAGTRYDLAGNPLPPLPKADAAAPVLPSPLPPASGPVMPGPPVGTSPTYVPAPVVRASPGPLLLIGLGGFLFVAVLVFSVIFGLKMLKPKTVLVPTAYKAYSAIDLSFLCDQPVGWTLHETGANNGNLATATFESGPARVRVVSDATGSLMADSMNAGNANLPPEQQVPVVEKLHVMDQKQLSGTLADYKEGDMQKFQSGVGDARFSEWTAMGSAGSLHGYRVTMLGNQREFTVICLCPEADWAKLTPTFQHIISSVKPGTPQ